MCGVVKFDVIHRYGLFSHHGGRSGNGSRAKYSGNISIVGRSSSGRPAALIVPVSKTFQISGKARLRYDRSLRAELD